MRRPAVPSRVVLSHKQDLGPVPDPPPPLLCSDSLLIAGFWTGGSFRDITRYKFKKPGFAHPYG